MNVNIVSIVSVVRCAVIKYMYILKKTKQKNKQKKKNRKKKQTYLILGFYNDVIFFQPGQDFFPKFRRHFATGE